jgi:hypothetical protein
MLSKKMHMFQPKKHQKFKKKGSAESAESKLQNVT